MLKSKAINRLSLYILLIIVSVFAVAPLLWVVSTSFKTTGEIFSDKLNWIPKNFTIENYIKAVKEYPLITWLINSMFITVSTIVFSTILYIMPAYALAKFDFKGKGILILLVISSLMIPKELTAIPVYKIVRMFGLIDTKIAVIVPQISEAIGVFLLLQFFRSIPDTFIEAAQIDGYNHISILFKIFVPLAMPAISVMTILTFVFSWNNFFWPLLVTFSNQAVPLPVGLSTIMVSYSEAGAARQYGLLMAISLIGSIPTILLFLFLQNKFVEGVTSSGIKG